MSFNPNIVKLFSCENPAGNLGIGLELKSAICRSRRWRMSSGMSGISGNKRRRKMVRMNCCWLCASAQGYAAPVNNKLQPTRAALFNIAIIISMSSFSHYNSSRANLKAKTLIATFYRDAIFLKTGSTLSWKVISSAKQAESAANFICRRMWQMIYWICGRRERWSTESAGRSSEPAGRSTEYAGRFASLLWFQPFFPPNQTVSSSLFIHVLSTSLMDGGSKSLRSIMNFLLLSLAELEYFVA